MVSKGRTHEELWQFIIRNSLTELVNGGFYLQEQETKNYCNRNKSEFKSG